MLRARPRIHARLPGRLVRWSRLAWLLLFLPGAAAVAALPPGPLSIVEPYLDLRTGPAEGYPVTQVAVRGESVELLYRRGEFVRVRTRRGIEGWARAADLNRGRLADGSAPSLPERGAAGFPLRRWEGGVLAGELDGARIVAAYAGARLAPGLQVELSASNVLSRVRSLYLIDAGLTYAPWRSRRLEPFVMAGYGLAEQTEGLPLAGTNRNLDRTAYAGLGLRAVLTGPLFARVDVRRRAIYAGGSKTEENTEWRIGIAFYP